ncbi:MAG TPA: HPF/RaiA family ribosome-associated protein [Gemmatimonadales bacterium]|nr:HPF/RaiA family ribosome-associated protein [Gemmatimonadales bacterium]
MQPTITVRHCEIPDALRERAARILDRLAQRVPRPIEGSVTFDVDGLAQTAEIRLHVSRGDVFVARGDGLDHRTALDRAEAKIRRQLDKLFPRPKRARRSIADQV